MELHGEKETDYISSESIQTPHIHPQQTRNRHKDDSCLEYTKLNEEFGTIICHAMYRGIYDYLGPMAWTVFLITQYYV